VPCRAIVLAFVACAAAQVAAQGAPIESSRCPGRQAAAGERRRVRGLAARAELARSVERHDVAAFESFLHAGTVFDVATPDAERGREAVLKSWSGIVDGRRSRCAGGRASSPSAASRRSRSRAAPTSCRR
jgi:hypothetical protein